MDDNRMESALVGGGGAQSHTQDERRLVRGPSSADALAGGLLGMLVGFLFVVLGQAEGVGAGVVAASLFGSLGLAHWLRGRAGGRFARVPRGGRSD